MTMTEQSGEKRALRARLRQRLTALDASTLAAQSWAAAVRLAQTPEFQRAQTVMVFLPLAYEVDARPVALRAWQAGKTVAVPLVSWKQKHMIPVEIKSLDEPMNVDRYGVQTPKTGIPQPIDSIDLVVVPGLGFDTTGQRIGRGGGFYDRFLRHPQFRGTICGLGFDQQVVDAVPVAAHDMDLQMLVTDQRTLRFKR